MHKGTHISHVSNDIEMAIQHSGVLHNPLLNIIKTLLWKERNRLYNGTKLSHDSTLKQEISMAQT